MDSSQPSQHSASAADAASVASRPLNSQEKDLLAQLDRLKFFLATAPSRWASSNAPQQPQSQSQHPALNRFLLPSGEYVSCVLWNGLYHITGTDIVRALVFRFEAFGRPVTNMKKFEEGVFSDLRNLKPGTDASLEEPKSSFLDLLFKYQCIRTQKKQKVFYWFSVPHDRLFLDALERDLKREKMGHEPTTVPKGEPALSFTFDPKQSLYDQFLNQNLKRLHDEDLENFDYRAPIGAASSIVATASGSGAGLNNSVVSPADILRRRAEQAFTNGSETVVKEERAEEESAPKSALSSSPFFSMFSLFEGSPTYKQRRKKSTKTRRPSKLVASSSYEQPPTPPYAPGGYQSNEGPSQSQHQDLQGRPSVALMPAHPSLAQAPTLQSYGLSSNLTADDGEGMYQPRLSHSPSSVSPPMANAVHGHVATLQKKGYVCPLYSCRKAFRRPEYLKRHIRAHRLEKPYPCDQCEKRFSRPDLLQQHQLIHTQPEGTADPTMGLEQEDEGMDIEVGGQALVPIDIPANQVYEDDNEGTPNAYPQPPRSAGARSDGSGHYYHGPHQTTTPPYATHPIMHSTSTETSPYVETPQGSGWAQVRGTQQIQRPTITVPSAHTNGLPVHHLDVYSADAYGGSSSNLSINVHAAAAYGQNSHIHPASAPAQKLAFDHSTLYPHPPQSATVPQPYSVGPDGLRRHRSATPIMGRTSLDGMAAAGSSSRPQTAVSNASGSISMVNNYSGQFAYTIDEANTLTTHASSRSSPLSQNAVYAVAPPQELVPSPHGSYASGHSNSPPHSLVAAHSNSSLGYLNQSYSGLDGYPVSSYTPLHSYVADGAVVPAALHDSPDDLHLAHGYGMAPSLGPASFHGSDDGSPKMYQYRPRSSGEDYGYGSGNVAYGHVQQGHPSQMSGQQAPSHGPQLPGYHYEAQQQVAL